MKTDASGAPRHPLARPIWSALTSRQQRLAVGGERARRYPADVSPFGAARDDEPASLEAAAALVPEDSVLAMLQEGSIPTPPGLIVEKTDAGLQLVSERRELLEGAAGEDIVPLTDADAPAMIELATLTRPGPFFPRTHTLGEFLGVKVDGRLAAMAGERMQLDGYSEVSGVCTHPDFRGRGYAAKLSRAVGARIWSQGRTPFLHAYADNAAAVGLYESLGFIQSRRMTMTLFRRPARP